MSSLSKQIANLGKSSNKGKKGKVVSLLFSQSDAAEVDAVTLLELARNALGELQGFDSRFNDFASSLFDSSSTTVDRTVLSPDENNSLDQSISRCLLLLSPYLSMKAAHRVLEYLIRQYQVNEYNVNSLMECCLMYHDSDFFSRLLETLHVDFAGSKWLFLKNARNQKMRISRKMIVDQISSDFTLLEFLGTMLFRAVVCAQEAPSVTRWQKKISWYSATVTSAMEAHPPSEGFLRALFPQLLKGLSIKNTPVLQVGLYLVIVKLVSSVELSDENVEALLLATLKSVPAEFSAEGITCAATIVQRAGLTQLSSQSFEYLCAIQPLDEFLAAASVFVDVSQLTSLFLHRAVRCIPTKLFHEEDICRILRNESCEVVVASLVSSAIDHYAESSSMSQEAKQCLSTIVSCCMESHGAVCDEAVKQTLKSMDGSKRQCGFELLTMCSHTNLRHLPVGNTETTFILALENHDPLVRLQALREVCKHATASSLNSDLHASIVRRLNDDDASVVCLLAGPACKKLLSSCFIDGLEQLSEVWKVLGRWTIDMRSEPKRCIEVVSTLLVLINELSKELLDNPIAREIILLANLEHFPKKCDVIFFSKYGVEVSAVKSLVLAAVKGVVSLSKTKYGDFEAFFSLSKESNIKKLEDIMEVAKSSVSSISRKIAEGNVSIFDRSWLRICALDTLNTIPFSRRVHDFIIDCVAESVQNTKKAQLTILLEEFVEVLPQVESKLRLLSPMQSDAIESHLSLIASVVVGVSQKESSQQLNECLMCCLLSLPDDLFNHSKTQVALQHMFQHHFNMEPLWYLSCVFKGASIESRKVCQLRALGLSQTFLASIAESKSIKAMEKALNQIAYSLPLWLSLLGNDSQLVRNTVLNLLQTVSTLDTTSFAIKLKPPTLVGYQDNARLPSLAAANLLKLSSLLCLQKKEMSMNGRAVSTCIYNLFVGAADSSWKQGREECISFLISHVANLGADAQWLHVVAAVLKQLAFKMSQSESSLNVYSQATWPACEWLGSYLVKQVATNEVQDRNTAKILEVIISEFVLSCHKGKIDNDVLKFLTTLLSSVSTLPKTPLLLANQSSAKFFFQAVSLQWCALLSESQMSSLFTTLINYGYMCPSFMHSISKVIVLLKLSPTNYVSSLTESCLTNKGLKLETILEFMEVSVEQLRKFPVKVVFSLIDSLFAVIEFCAASKNEDHKKCILSSLKLALQLMVADSTSTTKQFNTAMDARVDRFLKILQTLASSGSRDIKTVIIQVLVEFSKISPTKVFAAVSLITQNMLMEASSGNDITLLHFVENVLKEVIPYLSKSKDHKVNVGVFLQDLIESFEGSDIWKLNLFSSLVRSLSADVLPALVLMIDETLSVQLNHRAAPSSQLASSVKLLECAQQCLQSSPPALLPLTNPENSFMSLDLAPLVKANKGAANLALRCAEHVAAHGENKNFHYQLLRLNEDENKQVQSLYLSICQQLLFCIHDNEENGSDQNLARVFDRILNNLQNLLSVSGFIVMMQELLQDSEEWVRKRAIELLTNRVQAMKATNGISAQEAALFVDMVPELNELINESCEGSFLPTALCAIEILAREFAPAHPDVFLTTMDKVTSLLEAVSAKIATTNDLPVLCSGLLCAATLCSVLGLKAFPQIPKLVPVLLTHLKSFKPCDEASMDAFLIRSVLSLFISLFQYLPQFLHPHVEEVVNLTQAESLLNLESQSIDLLINKLYSSIGRGVSVRLLLPCLVTLCKRSLSKGIKASSLLLHMFREMVDCNKAQDLKPHSQAISKFLFELLEFREKSIASNLTPVVIASIESDLIHSLMSWVLKMNENELSNFLIVLLRWRRGMEESSSSDERLNRRLTFYRVLDCLTDKLKSIIVPYFDQFFDDCVGELQVPFKSNAKVTGKAKKQRLSRGGDDIDSIIASSFLDSLESQNKSTHLELLRYVVSSLRNCFENDREQICMNTKRVQLVMQPLIRQLGFAAADVEYVDRFVVPSVAQLAVLCGGDVMWKPLNHGVLMQTRDSNPAIRLHALVCVKECFSHVGEEFLAVLPESLSFLSELLEDSDPEVEAQCRAVLKYIEAVSGENIDEYL